MIAKRYPTRQPTDEPAIREDLIQALANVNCDPNLLERTRRATHVAALDMAEKRHTRRRNIGFCILAVLFILILLSPVLWSGVEDLAGGEHIADLPVQVALHLLILFPAMLAALIAVWKGQHSVYHDRRGS